ncbi:hypothetical protein PM082_016823 [Marasmius tenuissimus]|nr:hypothetical protein PM082_016823 [Marasmius tenuissimus]
MMAYLIPTSSPSEFTKPDNKGRLWTLGARRGLNPKDTAAMDEFEEAGDRIPWTRQRAEVYRWMEEFEHKHPKFHHMIHYLKKMAMVWQQIAESPKDPANAVEKLDANPEAYTAKLSGLGVKILFGVNQRNVNSNPSKCRNPLPSSRKPVKPNDIVNYGPSKRNTAVRDREDQARTIQWATSTCCWEDTRGRPF